MIQSIKRGTLEELWINAKMQYFSFLHGFLLESSGMDRNWAGMDRNGQEWTGMDTGTDRNRLK